MRGYCCYCQQSRTVSRCILGATGVDDTVDVFCTARERKPVLLCCSIPKICCLITGACRCSCIPVGCHV